MELIFIVKSRRTTNFKDAHIVVAGIDIRIKPAIITADMTVMRRLELEMKIHWIRKKTNHIGRVVVNQ